MRIYRMTATFGKLEHETLTLEPGLNIIEAPNEWGKSTWCAFLVAMLYGVETREKTTKTALAVKERYAPWSGSPMAGRMDLNWNGRDITIERRSKGRTVLGEFKAYETESGLQVQELTAANCGAMLLGVEKNVFTRAGFLRLTDLPVTEDEALRRRLNALVTTGDESGAGDALAQKLKDLKNRCRHNRTGLLPQAEAQRDGLEQKLKELEMLQSQSESFRHRQTEVDQRRRLLENHRDALRYAAAQADAGRVAEAKAIWQQMSQRVQETEEKCASIPSRETAEQAAASIRQAHQQWQSLKMEMQMLPQEPQMPQIPAISMEDAQRDRAEMEMLRKKGFPAALPLWILAAVLLALGFVIHWGLLIAGGVVLLGALALQLTDAAKKRKKQHRIRQLAEAYGSEDPKEWLAQAEAYRTAVADYEKEMTHFRAARGDLDQRAQLLKEKIQQLSGDTSLQEKLEYWLEIVDAWDQWADARRDLTRAESHVNATQAMAKNAKPPAFLDELTESEEVTARLLSDSEVEHRQLQLRQGQCQGRMEALGDPARLREELERVKQRIQKLEDTFAALELAQNALAEATAELQRKFAPKIAARAQELFGQLTGKRYDRLMLGEDLSLSIGAMGEDTVRGSMWRSDGTVDQLYLALRLAVAEELTPEAPLVLDDALVRFDDTRLAAAMEILRQEAENKQVILFTCQGREKNM